MADQQAILTEGELGWLAGIIEGEGSITMNVRKKSWKGWQGIGIDLTVCVSNTDGHILEKVVDLMKRLTGHEPYINEFKKSPVYKPDGTTYLNPKTSILNISLGRMEAILTALRAIEPYMVGEKVARARLMIKFIERRMNRKTAHTKTGMALFDKYDWETVSAFYALKKKPLPPEVKRVLNEHEQNGRAFA
jgi:hypothetical protein